MSIAYRDFESSSSEYGEIAAAVVSGPPFTFCAWIKAESVGAGMSIGSIATSGSSNHHFLFDVAAAGILRFRARDTGSSDALTTGEVTPGTWHFVAYRASANNSRSVFLDSEKANSTATRNPSGMNRTAIGRSSQSSGTGYFDGKIALPCLWNVALSDAEIADLAAGAYPTEVQSANIVSFWPWNGTDPELDDVGSNDLDMTGSTYGTDDEPPVTEPGGGGATYDETLSESLTLAVTVTATAAAGATRAEATSPADSVAASATSNAARAEATAVSDSASATATAAATASFAVAPDGSASASATGNASRVETITPSETLSVSATADATRAEETSLADSLAAAATSNAARAEEATASDSVAATATAAATASFTVEPTDSASGSATAGASRSEAITPSDALSASATSGASVSEPLTVSTAFAALADVAATLSEAIAASDSASAVATLAAALAEALTVAAAASASATAGAALAETVTPDATFSTGGGQVYNETYLAAVTVADAVAALATVAAERAETVAAADSMAAVAAVAASVAEAVLTGDSVAGAAVVDLGLSEGITPSDSATAAASAGPSVSEAISPADSAVAGVEANATAAESVALSETLAALAAVSPELAESVEAAVSYLESLGVLPIGIGLAYRLRISRPLQWTAPSSPLHYRGGDRLHWARRTMARAPQIRTKHPDAVKNAAVSFASDLEDDEVLAGTPTITSTPSDLTISSEKVNTAEIDVDGEATAIGKAVQFRVSGGTDGTKYNIKVVCATDSSPAQTLVAECALQVLDD